MCGISVHNRYNATRTMAPCTCKIACGHGRTAHEGRGAATVDEDTEMFGRGTRSVPACFMFIVWIRNP